MTTDLGSLGGTRTQAIAINNHGLIVGIAQTAEGDDHGFVWADGVLTDLGSGAAVGINDRGEIIGPDNA